MALSKKIRFEVFKRDNFTCQYCGKKAPEVVLHADHIEPKSKGGKDTLLNLVTACIDCNLGKAARRLSDDSAVEKQRAQLEELQAKQEQLTMMVEWQRSLLNLGTNELDEAASFWESVTSGYFGLSDSGKKGIRTLIRRFGLGSVLSAMRVAGESYIVVGPDGKPTSESVGIAYNKIKGICSISEAEKEKPWLREVFYIRGIIKNRFNYVNPQEAKSLLERAFTAGATAEELRRLALNVNYWTAWTDGMWGIISDLEDGDA